MAVELIFLFTANYGSNVFRDFALLQLVANRVRPGLISRGEPNEWFRGAPSRCASDALTLLELPQRQSVKVSMTANSAASTASRHLSFVTLPTHTLVDSCLSTIFST